jgi:hypothetical protein
MKKNDNLSKYSELVRISIEDLDYLKSCDKKSFSIAGFLSKIICDYRKRAEKKEKNKTIYNSEIMDLFYKINPTLNFGNRSYHKSANDLIEKFGLNNTINLTKAAISIQGEKYAPVITNPYELKEKFLKVKIFFDNKQPKYTKIS